MPGARCARSLACKIEKAHERSHHGHTGNTRHSLRNGLRLISCSPRRSGLFVTVASGMSSADLTPASRRQDHTTSPSASAPFVKGAIRVHRIPPRVCDDRETPLSRDGTADDIDLIWVSGEGKYFFKRDWTANSLICPSGKSASRPDEPRPSEAPGLWLLIQSSRPVGKLLLRIASHRRTTHARFSGRRRQNVFLYPAIASWPP
jgi:hypothetical protein